MSVAATATAGLARATGVLVARLDTIREEIEANAGVPAAGPDLSEFLAIFTAIAAVLPLLAPERTGRLITTSEMAAKMGVTAATVRRKGKTGEIQAPLRLGRRGRAALRWRA
jgi:hypothetical protein